MMMASAGAEHARLPSVPMGTPPTIALMTLPRGRTQHIDKTDKTDKLSLTSLQPRSTPAAAKQPTRPPPMLSRPSAGWPGSPRNGATSTQWRSPTTRWGGGTRCSRMSTSAIAVTWSLTSLSTTNSAAITRPTSAEMGSSVTVTHNQAGSWRAPLAIRWDAAGPAIKYAFLRHVHERAAPWRVPAVPVHHCLPPHHQLLPAAQQ